jgi:hypothetical protein
MTNFARVETPGYPSTQAQNWLDVTHDAFDGAVVAGVQRDVILPPVAASDWEDSPPDVLYAATVRE